MMLIKINLINYEYTLRYGFAMLVLFFLYICWTSFPSIIFNKCAYTDIKSSKYNFYIFYACELTSTSYHTISFELMYIKSFLNYAPLKLPQTVCDAFNKCNDENAQYLHPSYTIYHTLQLYIIFIFMCASRALESRVMHLPNNSTFFL